MAVKSDILTNDNKHLSIMENGDGIEVDKSLLKYSSIKKEIDEFRKEHSGGNASEFTINNSFVTPDGVSDAFKEKEEIKNLAKNYEIIKDSDVHGVNLFVSKHIANNLFSSFNEFVVTNNVTWNGIGNVNNARNVADQNEKPGFFKRLADLFNFKSKEAEEIYTLDVLDFFSNVKGLTKENKDLYVNRLTGYIVALKNCDVSGQVALKEKLLRDMVVNKYESVLYANGIYYVVTEDQIVNFVKKTQKGVRLTYVKNYLRVIPPEVVEKMNKANELEIFDNYAILHYDPEAKSYAETIKETQKRRDPILFGLIRGSNKLYYITDWIDEYCDLTLDKFVETLQIDKENLKIENIKM